MAGLTLAGGLASAANPSPQQIKAAADEFDRGIKAAQAGRFDEAASHFEAADREAPSPEALKAAIRARRDAKQGARASTLAAQALTRYPGNADLSAFAKGVVDQFGKGLHKVTVACKPECVLVVDNKLVPAEAAADMTLYLDPGKHTVAAGWNDKTQSKDVTATAGGSSSLAFTPPKEDKPAPSASAAATPRDKEPPREAPTATETAAPKKGLPPTVAYVGIGLTVVLGGVTAWSGLDAQSNPGTEKVKEQCVGLGEGCPAYKDGRSRQLRTNVLLGVTGGAALATVVVAAFFTDWKGGEPPSTASAAARPPRWLPGISFDSGGAQLHAAGRF